MTDYYDEDEPNDYRNSDAFRTYYFAVERLVMRSRDGITTAQIHRILGSEQRRWTMAALEMIPDVQEVQRGDMTAWRINGDPLVEKVRNYREWSFNSTTKDVPYGAIEGRRD